MADQLDLRAARAEAFEPHVGSAFHCVDTAPPFVLAEVYRLGSQPNAPRQEPFGIVFTGPEGLQQGTYRVDHLVLGSLDLFLVPIGPGPDGVPRYEAVFN